MKQDKIEIDEFAFLQTAINNTDTDNEIIEMFREKADLEEPDNISRFDNETRSYLLKEILLTTTPLIAEIERLTNLNKSKFEIEEDTKKLQNDAELAKFSTMQAAINEV